MRMADEEANNSGNAAKKKLPMKLIIIIAVVMIVEGALFGAIYFVFGEKPPAVSAQTKLEEDAQAEKLDEVEVLLIGDKFQNTRQGAQSYLYDATIYVVVLRRDQEFIQKQIEENPGRISEEITEIFARAEPAQLNEPDKLTLKRQIKERCEKRFGRDEEQKPYVRDVVISNWKRFSADN